MATLDDVVTTQKNGVIGINNIGDTWKYLSGTSRSPTVSATTTIVSGHGRIVSCIVIAAGTTTGTISDGDATAGWAKVFTIPNTIGVYAIGAPFSQSIIVTPGTGQVLNVIYSMEPR